MTRGAAFQVVSPDWSAAITQVPGLVYLTTPAASEQAPAVEPASTEKVTGSPELAVEVGV